MNIIIVADHAYINGGQAKVCIDSAKGLAARGHRVIYFAAVGPADDGLVKAGVEVVLLDQEDSTSTASLAKFGVQWLWNAAAAQKLRVLLARFDPSDTVVHVHAWAKALSPSIGPVLTATKIPRVFTMHEYYLACPNGGFYDYPISTACHREPMSLECIGYNCDSRSYARKLMRVGRHALMMAAGLPRSVQHIITISHLQREALRPYLPSDLIYHMVGNPIDSEALGQKGDAPLGDFLFVGRLSPEKGPRVFAEAARLAKLKAVFVGDGPSADELRRDFPEAEFLGWKSPAEVKALMRQARALVFPSVWYEGQPLTVYEALGMGTPVLVSDICAGREAVDEGENGLWFRNNDPASLAEAMQRMMDEPTAREMAKKAYARYWAAPLSLEKHVDAVEKVYQAALKTA